MMSLQDDFSRSGLDVKGYIRLIWSETELEGDHFSGLDYFDFEMIKPIVVNLIDRIEGVTQFRKNMYRTFLNKLETAQEYRTAFEEWLSALNAYIELDSEKRNFLAKYMTRVLRGDFINSHYSLPEALHILRTQRTAVWDQYKLRLEKLCNSMGIN